MWGPAKDYNMCEDMVYDSCITPTPSEQGTKCKRGCKLVVTTQHDKPNSLVQVKDNQLVALEGDTTITIGILTIMCSGFFIFYFLW